MTRDQQQQAFEAEIRTLLYRVSEEYDEISTLFVIGFLEALLHEIKTDFVNDTRGEEYDM